MYKFVNFNNITSNLKKLNFKDLIIFVIPFIKFVCLECQEETEQKELNQFYILPSCIQSWNYAI